MEDAVRQRIRELLNFKKVTPNKLSNSNSAKQMRYSRQLNRDGTITCQTLLEILNTFDDVSAEWLMRGVGTMIRGDAVSVGDNNRDIAIGHNINQGTSELIRVLEEQNKTLQEQVSTLQQQVSKLIEKI